MLEYSHMMCDYFYVERLLNWSRGVLIFKNLNIEMAKSNLILTIRCLK